MNWKWDQSSNSKLMGSSHTSHDVTRLRLQVSGEALAFAAGQYARLMVGKLPARSYSMASSPGDDVLEFHVRRVPEGLVSGYIASELKTGDKIRLEAPFGTAYLREDHAGPIIAAGGGTGLAPVLSIARRALAQMPGRPLYIYFGVRSEADIYAARELEVLAAHEQVRVSIVLSDPGGPTSYRSGYIHHALEQDFDDLSNAKVYLCGPPPMVTAMTASAQTLGVRTEDIHSDPFTSSANPGDSVSTRDDETESGLIGILSRLFKTPQPGAVPADAGNAGTIPPTAPGLPAGMAPGRSSTRLLPPYLEHAKSAQALLPWLYLQGITVTNQRQLLTQWQREYILWSRRDLTDKTYLYWWADTIYHPLPGFDEPRATLLLAGVDGQGKMEFIALERGGHESQQNWLTLLGRLRRRGLQSAPQLVVADSASDIWTALQEIYPRALQQYCWQYEMARCLPDVSEAMRPALQASLRKVFQADDRQQAEKRFYQFLYHYWIQCPRAAENMEKTLHALLRFYHFPPCHRRYLRSSALLSTVFSGLSIQQPDSAHDVMADLLPAVLYQLGSSAEQRWPELVMAAAGDDPRRPALPDNRQRQDQETARVAA